MEIATTNLVLTRSLGERIMIGESITIEVVGVRDGDVRLMISAPRDVLILREELLAKRRQT